MDYIFDKWLKETKEKCKDDNYSIKETKNEIIIKKEKKMTLEEFQKILSIKEKESNDKLKEKGYIFSNEITENIIDEVNNYKKEKKMKKEEKIINFEFELLNSKTSILHWKFENDNQYKQIVNPTVKDIEPLLKYKMIGKSKNDLLYLSIYITQFTLKKEN